jgi:hypothetical protein
MPSFGLVQDGRKILAGGIHHQVFRGLKFEPNAEIDQKGVFLKGLAQCLRAEVVELGRHAILRG